MMISMTAERIDDLVLHLQTTLPDNDVASVQHAYEVAAHAHRHQRRKSGEPYITHVVATADILAELRVDTAVIIAGLLHDTVEDTEVTLEDIRRDFGDEVGTLVDGVTKLGKISEVTGSRKRILGHMETESLRKMFLAMSRDVRVVLVKLADRLHNMRTLHALSRQKQQAIARETLEIFAPLANRLGIWQIKWELEDLCLRYLEPATYYDLVMRLNERREEREAFIQESIVTLKKALHDLGIEADISGRSKHLYSIYKKMKRKERDLDQIFDVRALRLIVGSKAECYAALGVVHGLWRPVPGEFDDYIANPKGNNYQSLHTAVYADKGKPLEIQIRDTSMHRWAEYGVAAHWRYKEATRGDSYVDQQVAMFRRMMSEVQGGAGDAEEFVEEVRSDILPDHIFVYTPKGDIKELPAGATPIDFAYYIHTNIGDRCVGAKVNGVQVPLNTTLTYGDKVEILKGAREGPSLDWLNDDLNYVTTSRAKSKIRQFFRKQGYEENVRTGRESLEKELRRMGIRVSKVNLEKLAKDSKFDKVDDFLAQIGSGELSAHRIAAHELEARRTEEAEQATKGRGIQGELATYGGKALGERSHTATVSGVDGLMTRIARCCNPVLGDDTIGYVTVGKGITVHRRDCPQMIKGNPERMVEVSWGNRADTNEVFTVPIKVLAFDRDGLLHDITEVVSNEKVNLGTVTATTDKTSNSAVVTAQLEVKDAAQLARILARIARLPNVYEVRRAGT
jgi:RelA/SpoT family (p)ppGpp synthetase